MSRPQIIVTVTGAIARRGAPTDTGVAFVTYAGAAGPVAPVRVKALSDAVAASVPDTVAALIGDALNQGTPEVVVVKAAAVDPEAVTEAEWTAALGLFHDGFGPGQVLIPGVATPAAHAALLAHANTSGRCVLLDGEVDATSAELVTLATGLAAGEGAERAGLIAPWVNVPGAGGVARQVPGSIIAAGLAAREDAVAGHANSAPAGDKGYGAGVVRGGLAPTVLFTDAQHDALHDAGVSVIRDVLGAPTLYGWVSLSDDPTFRQLNVGRMTMQLATGIKAGARKFLFKNIDGQGHLYAEFEGFLRAYLQPLWIAGALYGAEADDAYDVDVQGVNTAATAADGELHSVVAAKLTQHTEKVIIDVTTSLAEGV